MISTVVLYGKVFEKKMPSCTLHRRLLHGLFHRLFHVDQVQKTKSEARIILTRTAFSRFSQPLRGNSCTSGHNARCLAVLQVQPLVFHNNLEKSKNCFIGPLSKKNFQKLLQTKAEDISSNNRPHAEAYVQQKFAFQITRFVKRLKEITL